MQRIGAIKRTHAHKNAPLYQALAAMTSHLSGSFRLIALLIALWGVATCWAQGKDKSLTKDFAKLSAKERSRIATQETQEADRDTAYQRLMGTAEQAFREGRYEDALAMFEEARELRPYNVYPKVKIEDLQALIRKRDSETRPPEPIPEPIPEPLPETVLPPAIEEIALQPTPPPVAEAAAPPQEQPETPPLAEVKAPDPVVEAPAAMVEEKPDTPRPVAAPSRPSREPAPPAAAAPPELPPAPQLGERIYLEAGAVVTERTVEDEGKVVVYKRVAHSWGQTFYFREGLSIPDRRWEERFSAMER